VFTYFVFLERISKPYSSLSPSGGDCFRVPSCLSSGVLGHILHGVDPCRRCSARFRVGRSVCQAVVIWRMVKLVHQSIKSGEADTGSWPRFPVAPRVLGAILPHQGATIFQCVSARCLLDHDGSPCANPFSGGSHDCCCSSPWPQRVKLPIGSDHAAKQASATDADERSAENSSPPLSVPRARRAGRRLTTAPGTDPVSPAAQLTSFACASGHPVAASVEPAPTIRRWPS
jgi:hypothetical protein